MFENQSVNSTINVLVLGGTGMVGQALVKEAKSRGLTYLTVSRKNADINLDLTDRFSLINLIKDIQPQLVINSIAKTSLDYCERYPCEAYLTNTSIAGNVASICMERDIKFCHISTDHYFSGDKDKLHGEGARIKLLNEYAKTKYLGECFALLNPRSIVIRTNVVGFRGWPENPTFVEWLINEFLLKKKIIMFEDFYTSSIHVKQFSNALFDLFEKDASGLVNLASRECASKKDFILKIADRLNFDVSNCNVGRVNSNLGVSRAESLGLDVSYAENILGYQLPSTDEVVDALCSDYEELI